MNVSAKSPGLVHALWLDSLPHCGQSQELVDDAGLLRAGTVAEKIPVFPLSWCRGKPREYRF